MVRLTSSSDTEAKLYEKLLLDALHGDLDAVKASFDDVEKLRNPHLSPLYPVATSGALRGYLQILQFCLSNGAEMNKDVALAIKKGSNATPEMAAYYEENKSKVEDLTELKHDPAKLARPQVPMETRREIDRLLGR